MNLLEHYIVHIISVQDVTKLEENIRRKENPDFIETDPVLEVKMMIDCYGHTQETIEWFHKSEWEKIQEQGYYLA